MTDERGIVERLRDYDDCPDQTIDEAADMLEFLLEHFQAHSLKMDGQHSYRLKSGWPLTHMRGPTIEVAIKNAMAELKRGNEEVGL